MNIVERLLERDILVDPERFKTLSEQQVKQLDHALDGMSDEQVEEFLSRGSVEILWSYTKRPSKRTYQDFVGHFNRRLEQIGALLRQRQELASPTSIARIKENDRVAAIGIVWEKRETKNGHIILELEDQTGKTNVLLSKNRPELLELGQDIMLDEVIGVTGKAGDGIIFADAIIHPDIPVSHELKKAPDESYAIFISDLHFGGKNFFYDGWERFIRWLNGEVGGKQHAHISKRVKYLFIIGDLIEGVGIYPGQENDLKISDVKEQYVEFSKHIAQIPQRIQIVMCPGNHDAGRLAEPQYDLYQDFTADMLDLPNVHLVSNPSVVRIHRSKDFGGFDVLLYHGYSFIYYGNNVPSIFNEGAVNRPDLIMRYLLQRRHLAPTHTSNLYIPDPVADPLVISDVPDFFVTGHTHHAVQDTYRGVTLLNCSCWVPITDNQRNYGLTPDPGKVPIVNLKTRQVRLLPFVKTEEDDA